MILIDTCRDAAERLPEYLEQRLSADECLALEEHLRTCSECRARLVQVREVAGLLAGVLGSEAPAVRGAESAQFRQITTGPRLEVSTQTDEAPEVPRDRLLASLGAAPWWAISGAFHGLLLILLTLIGMAVLRTNEKEVVILTNLEKRREVDPPDVPAVRDVFMNPVPVESNEVSSEAPIVTHEEVEVAEHVETANDADASETRGENGISDVLLGGSGTAASLGTGGGGGGAFGRPTGAGGRLRRAIKGGGGKATESAVDRALEWLARHQEKDGFWDTDKYLDNKHMRYGGSRDLSARYDPGMTGFAALAFLGAGHSMKVGKYKENVRRAVTWLLAQQGPDGDFTFKVKPCHLSVTYYCHCIATLACAEALAMNNGKDWGEGTYGEAQGKGVGLKEAVQRGVDLILKWQEGNAAGGWAYSSTLACDVTVSGWAVMALKSAKIAGIKVPHEAFTKASEAVRKCMVIDKTKGDYGMATTGYLGAGSLPFQSRGFAITAASMVIQEFVGADRMEGGIEAAGAYITQPEALPDWSFKPQDPTTDHQNLYYWYYGTLGCFQKGGDTWKLWNEKLKAALLPHQRVDARKDGSPQDVDGSWDPDDVWGAWGGRVYSTCLGALSLEVYYRYLPLYR